MKKKLIILFFAVLIIAFIFWLNRIENKSSFEPPKKQDIIIEKQEPLFNTESINERKEEGPTQEGDYLAI